MKSAKPVHSNAFLKSLSSLTKHKLVSASQQEERTEKKLIQTPLKSKHLPYASSESESSDDQPEIVNHLKQHIAKPKLFMPSSSISKEFKPKKFDIKELPDQQIPSYEVMGNSKSVSSELHKILIKDQTFKPD